MPRPLNSNQIRCNSLIKGPQNNSSSKWNYWLWLARVLHNPSHLFRIGSPRWIRVAKFHSAEYDFENRSSNSETCDFINHQFWRFWHFIFSKRKETYFENNRTVNLAFWKSHRWPKCKNQKFDPVNWFCEKVENQIEKAKCKVLLHGTQWWPSQKHRGTGARWLWKSNSDRKHLKHVQFVKFINQPKRR